MKKNKIFAGVAATVLALSMMVGTAFANPLFVYGDEDGARESSKGFVTVELLSGGGNLDGENGKVYPELQAMATEARSVDVLLTGTFKGTAHLNFAGDDPFTPDGSGYDNKTFSNRPIEVDGFLVYSGEFGEVENDGRFAFLLRNKEGSATLQGYILRNADGAIIGGINGDGFLNAAAAEAFFNTITGASAPAETPAAETPAAETPAAPAAPVTDSKSTPKTGVASMAIIFGLGAAAFGTGAIVLKKKEN